MALSPDLGMPAPASVAEGVHTAPHQIVIFESTDPRLGEMTREERITQYYARELAAGNVNALKPRFRTPEDGSDQEPDRDILVADPLNDPRVSELATMLVASGFKQEPDPGNEF